MVRVQRRDSEPPETGLCTTGDVAGTVEVRSLPGGTGRQGGTVVLLPLAMSWDKRSKHFVQVGRDGTLKSQGPPTKVGTDFAVS